MINLDSITNENNKEYNKKWPYLPHHPYRILIIGGSRSRKQMHCLLRKEQDNIDKMYLSAKDLSKPKYEFLIKKLEDPETKQFNDSSAFICVQIEWMTFMAILMIATQAEEEKYLIVFDGMIADIMTNKKFKAIIKELFIRCRKVNI